MTAPFFPCYIAFSGEHIMYDPRTGGTVFATAKHAQVVADMPGDKAVVVKIRDIDELQTFIELDAKK